MADDMEIMDFSYVPTPKQFKIGPDIFTMPPELPLTVVGELMKFTTGTQDIALFVRFFDLILDDASAARFRERCESKTEPIGLATIQKILPWVLEVYGLRPTEASSNSAPSSEDDGTTSTDGVPVEESAIEA